jgi:hypothetical protein
MRGWLVRRGMVPIVVVAGTLLGATTLGAGCSDDGDDDRQPPPEVGGSWERGAVRAHGDVYFGFDRVAVGSGPEALSWMSRRERGDTGQLAYSEVLAGADATSTDLPVAAGGPAVLIPVGVAADAEGWAAVAATRDQPRGDNTGLLAWQVRRTNGEAPQVPPGATLVPPPGVSGPPQLASIGRANGASAIAALVGGQVVVWSLPEGPTGAPWEVSQPELELDGTLVHLQVTGDGERFVLAGVDDRGRGHLWTSRDGRTWQALPDDRPPDGGVGAVGLLAPLDEGQVAVGWLADEDSAPANATRAIVQRLEGDRLVDEGAISRDTGNSIDRLDLGGATLSPAGRLVVVGAALRASGDRAPMLWARDSGTWASARRSDLTSRLDYELRAVAIHDERMVALVTSVAHVDLETWNWRPPGGG